MAKKANQNVTMRIRLGDNELEVMGPTDFVEQKISEFIELNKKKPLLAPSSKVPTSTLTVTKTAETVKKISAAQFFKKVKPSNDLVRTLTAGYYLEVFTGVESFTASEIRDLIREAKIPPPKNPNDAINKNIMKGKIMAAGDKEGKRAFVLTSDGEEEIKALIE